MESEVRPEPPCDARRALRRRVLASLATVGAGVVALIGLFLAVFAVAISRVHSEPKRPEHLKPIPVAAEACPVVEAIHRAANELQAASSPVDPEQLVRGNLEYQDWSVQRARLARAGDSLQGAIAFGQSTFPPRVRRYLRSVSEDIDAGRRELAAARDYDEYSDRTDDLWTDGQRALGYASDLVGDQCRVRLGAGSATLLYPLFTTTSTTQVRR